MQSIISVTTPSSYQYLTTLDRVKQELSITDNGSDAILTSKISEASSDIFARIWPRPRETVMETFYPEPGQSVRRAQLMLSRWPLVSVTTATVDGESVVSDNYRIDAEAGMLLYLADDGYRSCWTFSRSAEIVYVGGFSMPGEVAQPTLPPALEAACVELVSSYWFSRGRDPTIRQEEVQNVGSQTFWVGAIGESGSLPPGVESKIAPYRRVVIA